MGLTRSRRAVLVAGLAGAGVLIAAGILLIPPLGLAAEPGSKDDPLATVGYVERFAQFNSVTLPARQSLRIGVGTEFVVTGAPGSAIRTTEFRPLHDQLVDLTAGEEVLIEELVTCHHYLNASSHDIFFSFEGETTLMIRGSWK